MVESCHSFCRACSVGHQAKSYHGKNSKSATSSSVMPPAPKLVEGEENSSQAFSNWKEVLKRGKKSVSPTSLAECPTQKCLSIRAAKGVAKRAAKEISCKRAPTKIFSSHSSSRIWNNNPDRNRSISSQNNNNTPK